MYTQCPACKTVFRFHPDQLKAAKGQVRCSRCQTVFNALDNLFQTPTPEAGKKHKATRSGASAKKVVSGDSTGNAPKARSQQKSIATSPRAAEGDTTNRNQTGKSSSQQVQSTKKASPRPLNKADKKADVPGKQPSSDPKINEKANETASKPDAPVPVGETLPLLEPSDKLTADTNEPPPERYRVEQAQKTAEPSAPLFEFKPAIKELPLNAESSGGKIPTSTPMAETEKKRSSSPTDELDLFASQTTEPHEQNDALLFRYMPADATKSDLAQKSKDDPQKLKQARPGYSLPLEQEIKVGNPLNNLLWGGGIALMLGGLALQYIYYHRLTLAEEPTLRPVLAQMCRLTGCQLPAQRDLARIELGKHLVQVHPRYVDSLLITATLVNRADFAQPFPIVEVVMTNLEQKQVARRRFLPREYLIGSNDEQMLPPETEVPLMLEVLDPGKNAVGFEFNFY